MLPVLCCQQGRAPGERQPEVGLALNPAAFLPQGAGSKPAADQVAPPQTTAKMMEPTEADAAGRGSLPWI